jgi:Lipopolysaccharide-assembly
MKYEVRSTKYNSPMTGKGFCVRRVVLRTSYFVLVIALLFFAASTNSSCNIYKFNEAVVPDSIKTIKINFIENKAPYVNPQLSPRLTDRLRQKIISQTKLAQTNNDNADWVITGNVSNYAFSTSAISQQREATNRLTIGVRITINDQKSNKTTDYDVSRSFEFAASQTIQQAEATLGDEIIRSLTDDIFNKIFSNW